MAGSGNIQEFCSGMPWKLGAVLPKARTGSSLAAVKWVDDQLRLRVYYQAPDLSLKEHCCDGGWITGM